MFCHLYVVRVMDPTVGKLSSEVKKNCPTPLCTPLTHTTVSRSIYVCRSALPNPTWKRDCLTNWPEGNLSQNNEDPTTLVSVFIWPLLCCDILMREKSSTFVFILQQVVYRSPNNIKYYVLEIEELLECSSSYLSSYLHLCDCFL